MGQLGADHQTVAFVSFGREHANVAAKRKPLYDLLPGRKERVLLRRSGHYFNAYGSSGIVIADTRVLREVEKLFRRLGREE